MLLCGLILSLFVVGPSLAELCNHCSCDSFSKTVICTSPSLLIRTLSLFPYVEQLHLKGLNLPHLPHILFHHGLRILRVNKCGLEELSPHSLLSIPALQVLDLSDNHLQTLPTTFLRSLKSLRIVNLANNRISNLDQLSWLLSEGLVLEQLDLSGNPLAIATKQAILPPLHQIFLSNANLEKLNSTALVFRPSTDCPYHDSCRSLLLDAGDVLRWNTVVLANNPHLHLDSSGLDLLENVTYLSLAGASLPPDITSWVEERSRAKHLNLSAADIPLEDETWMSCGPSLDTFDLSGIKMKRLNLARDCPVKVLHAQENMLESLHLETVSLESLHLDRNLLTDWPELPPGTTMSQLKYLSVGGNLLTSLPKDALLHFPALQHLDISKNQLNQIDAAAFPSIGMQLISLDLSSNRLTHLPHNVLPSLLLLDASFNDINIINPLLFAGLPLVQHLHLANNPALFSSCTDDLCWSNHLDQLTNLIDLDLSNCALSLNLPLSHLTSLRRILLRGNHIMNVDATDLPRSVHTLDLGENRIHLTTNFSHLKELTDLRVDSNPLRCDCSLHTIVDHLANQSQISDPNLYYCYSGSWQYPLLPYLATVRPCTETTQAFIPVLISTFACAVIFVSTVLLVAMLYRRFSHRFRHVYARLATDIPCGAAVAVGEQPIKGLVSPSAGARMSLAETLNNLVFAPISDIRDVKMSGNWMWAAKCEGEGQRLVEACDALCQALNEAGCAIDGGKDSLSMAAKAGGELVKAPGTLVLSAYAPCTDVTKVISPDLKGPQGKSQCSSLIYIRNASSPDLNRLGGSALAQVLKQIGSDSPDVESISQLVKVFNLLQTEIVQGKILSGHDISDGGLITCLLEMAFSGNIQLSVDIHSKQDVLSVLFAEESGIIVEVTEDYSTEFINKFTGEGVYAVQIGRTQAIYGPHAKVTVNFNDNVILNESLVVLREVWEETGDRLGLMQTEQKCLQQAKQVRESATLIKYNATFDWNVNESLLNDTKHFSQAPKVAIIREEGSNGDREMAAAFTIAGFQTFDVTMTDLLSGLSLSEFRGIAFVGGFSYADVLGSAKGWAAAIRYNANVAAEFENFRKREDTFSFGVCNGCQLMALLGWVGEYDNQPSVFLAPNKCGRFESSFGPVRIEKSRALMLTGMEGSVLGLWASHGEGRFTYRSPTVYDRLNENELIAVRYTDEEGTPTEKYPWNPNGSVGGVAAICSENGRHLAMMPHSDRSFLSWHWPNYPASFTTGGLETSPWIKMFQNAYEWCNRN